MRWDSLMSYLSCLGLIKGSWIYKCFINIQRNTRAIPFKIECDFDICLIHPLLFVFNLINRDKSHLSHQTWIYNILGTFITGLDLSHLEEDQNLHSFDLFHCYFCSFFHCTRSAAIFQLHQEGSRPAIGERLNQFSILGHESCKFFT